MRDRGKGGWEGGSEGSREGGREGGKEGGRDTRRSARRGYAHKHAIGCLTLHWHVEGGFHGNIKEFQDHEHTIPEESGEEMDMEKP